MTTFAIQVDLADGSTIHSFGCGDPALKEAYAMRDGWRVQPSGGYYRMLLPGEVRDVYVRDIRDVRVVVGAAS